MKLIPTIIWGLVVGVLSAIIATLLIITFDITEAKIVNIDKAPQAPVVEGVDNGQNGDIVFYVIENYFFKNNGFKSGFIDKIEVKSDGLKITPQVEIIFIDKKPLRWREERKIKCEYLIKLNRSQCSKLDQKLRDSTLITTHASFRTHFYDNSGQNIYSGSIRLYFSNKLIAYIAADLLSKIKVNDKTGDFSKVTLEDLTELDNMLSQIKSERDYTSEIWHLKGINEYYKKNYPAVITYVSKSIELGRETALIYFLRASAYGYLDQYEKAIEDYSASIGLELDFWNAIAYINRGGMFLKLNQSEKAIEDYSEAIKLKTEYPLAYQNRGATYVKLKQYDKAIEDLNKAIELDPQDSGAYQNRGIAYAELKKHDKAIEDFNKAIELGQENTNAYYNRGRAYFMLKQYERAIKDLNKTIELGQKNTNAYQNRGTTYVILKQYDKAIEDFNKVIELDPEYVSAYINRGAAYGTLKQYDKAFEDLNKAIELDPEYVDAFTGISELKIIRGNYESALDSITKGLSLQIEIKNKAILLYLKCITKKLLNMDTSESEAAFNEILKKDFNISWSFEQFNSWLEDADIINDDKKKFIIEKTEKLKKHKK